MRKLASIKEVSDLIPIEGRDRIELAIIDGWQVMNNNRIDTDDTHK